MELPDDRRGGDAHVSRTQEAASANVTRPMLPEWKLLPPAMEAKNPGSPPMVQKPNDIRFVLSTKQRDT